MAAGLPLGVVVAAGAYTMFPTHHRAASAESTDLPEENMHRYLTRLAALALLMSLGATTSQAAGGTSVAIKDLTFSPKTMTVKAGTTVTWTNRDDVAHTVTSGDAKEDKRFAGSLLIAPGKTFTMTFRKTGRYPYYCKPHFYNPNMHGSIVVTN